MTYTGRPAQTKELLEHSALFLVVLLSFFMFSPGLLSSSGVVRGVGGF